MCISTIMAWFKKEQPPAPPPPGPPPPPLTPLPIPHPEEAADYTVTMNNYNIDAVFNKWMHDYQVPAGNYDYWRNVIEIEVTGKLDTPAATWQKCCSHKRHLAVKPEYLNPGVLAHEQAHNSYALLTGRQKKEFSAVYTPLKTSDPLIAYLFSINTYGLTSDIEGHAEIYRFLCEQMPQTLKKYYPKLME
jgi:hypothetical protein